jgi:NAD(P)-dependent dehydrogenase (short-subunit alcohol dehydrogenase family)
MLNILKPHKMLSKTILVTGGNRGIGLEICKQLAELGHAVIMGTRDIEKGQKEVKILKGKIYVRQLDVINETDINNLVIDIKKNFGALDVLINNAGILLGSEGTAEANMEEVRQTMEANFYGPWRISQLMLPLLDKSKEGRIINMSSSMGAWESLALGGHAAYRLSKTALNGLTVQMSNELSNTKIKVNAMSPGWVRTDMGGAGASLSVEEGADTATWLATAEEIPTGKFFKARKEISW